MRPASITRPKGVHDGLSYRCRLPWSQQGPPANLYQGVSVSGISGGLPNRRYGDASS